jgi:intracellular septation protein
MSERTSREPAGLARLAIDVGPLLVFFLVNFLAPVPGAIKIFVATGAFMAAMVAALIFAAIRYRYVSPLLLFSAVMVVVLGGLTIWLHNETFIKIKPTIIYCLFGGVLLGGLLFGKSLMGYVFDAVFKLDDDGWRKLTVRWGLFFFGLAVLNEIVRHFATTDQWVTFKVFAIVPLTFVFALTQMGLISRHSLDDKEAE